MLDHLSTMRLQQFQDTVECRGGKGSFEALSDVTILLEFFVGCRIRGLSQSGCPDAKLLLVSFSIAVRSARGANRDATFAARMATFCRAIARSIANRGGSVV